LSNSIRTPLRRALDAYRKLDLSKPPVTPPRAAPVRRVVRLNAVQLDRLVERYESGALVKDLAAEFGIDRRTISHHLRERGIALRPYPPTTEVVDEMVRLYESGLPLMAVGETTGFSAFVVQRQLRERGVVIRPKTRRKKQDFNQ
jgi:DNA-binding transcriptional ArsR family regulator